MIIAELNMTTILANMQIFLNRIERKTRHHTDAKSAKMNNSIFISFFQRNPNLQVKETKIDVCFPSLSAEIRWGNTEMHYYKTTWISTTLSSGRKNTKNRNFLKRMQETWSNDWIKTNNSTNIFQRYTSQYKFYIENWICWKNTLLFLFPYLCLSHLSHFYYSLNFVNIVQILQNFFQGNIVNILIISGTRFLQCFLSMYTYWSSMCLLLALSHDRYLILIIKYYDNCSGDPSVDLTETLSCNKCPLPNWHLKKYPQMLNLAQEKNLCKNIINKWNPLFKI